MLYLRLSTGDFMRIGIFLALLILVSAAFAAPLHADAGKNEERSAGFVVGEDPVGQPLVDFEGVTVDGRVVSTEEMRGKVLLISLWGINCGSCIDEMKVLEPIYQEFGDRGLEIWAVNTEQMGSEEIRLGLEEKKVSVSYALLMDEGLTITRIFTSWFIPVTVIVDRKGTVQYYKIGFNSSDEEKIRGVVGELLK